MPHGDGDVTARAGEVPIDGELVEVRLPRLPLSVQYVSATFVLRENSEPRLVGDADAAAEAGEAGEAGT